tara:strand:- start:649 stop:1077 length:429 start_codon:yes stop_codon:yes gene_type:complete
VDLFGRERKHADTASFPKGFKPQDRVSFTAMSSVNMRTGVVKEVSDLKTRVLFSDEAEIEVNNYHDHNPKVGDVVHALEHFYVGPNNGMSYVLIPHPSEISSEMLSLQSVNADVLDESGELVYRLSADPLFKGGSHGAPVES